MANLASSNYNDNEWAAIQAGGVLGMFNGNELPWKYLPESKTVKKFGMLPPDVDCTVAQAGGGSLAAGTYVVTFVEVDSRANQGEGLRSGPPRGSSGQTVVVGASGVINVTLPGEVTNPDADEYWIYLTLPDGAWPTLGRVATTSASSLTYQITGTTDPDFSDYPLDPNRREAPAKSYPMKMRRRLLLWGSNEFSTDFTFTIGSNVATYVSGDPVDHGIIGAVVYPDDSPRGYLVTDVNAGSPSSIISITLRDNFVGTEASQETSTITCRICHPSGQLAWSEPDDYENFPAANVRYVELSAADPETGCVEINGVGLLFTIKKTFVVFFDVRPDVGSGQIKGISKTIGCLSHRTIQDVGGMVVWLAQGGLAASMGGAPAIISDEIRSEFEAIIREPTGRVRNAFAVNWPDAQRYMCFVPDEGDTVGCSKAIVMDYSAMPGEPQYRFSIYKFEKQFVSAAIEIHTSTSGTTNYPTYPVLGDKDGYAWSFGIGDADGPDSGTVSGTVTEAATSPAVLVDTSATFDTDGLGLAGMTVTVRRQSDDEEQTKLLGSNTSNTLYPDEEWDWAPSEGDTYRIGGIDAYYETGWSSIGGDEKSKGLYRLISTHKAETGGSLDFKVYTDFSSTEISTTNEGTSIDLSTASGRNSTKLSKNRAHYVKCRWENYNPDEPFTLRNANLISEADEPR